MICQNCVLDAQDSSKNKTDQNKEKQTVCLEIVN